MDQSNLLMQIMQMLGLASGGQGGSSYMGASQDAPLWMRQAPAPPGMVHSLLGGQTKISSTSLAHAQQSSLQKVQYSDTWKKIFSQVPIYEQYKMQDIKMSRTQKQFLDMGGWAGQGRDFILNSLTDREDRNVATRASLDESERFLLRNKRGRLQFGYGGQHKFDKSGKIVSLDKEGDEWGVFSRVNKLANWASEKENKYLGIGGADHENFQRLYLRYGLNTSNQDSSSEGILSHQKGVMTALGMGRKVLGTKDLPQTISALKELTQGTIEFSDPEKITSTLKSIGALATGLKKSIPEIIESVQQMKPLLMNAGLVGGDLVDFGAVLPIVTTIFLNSQKNDAVMQKAIAGVGGHAAATQTLMGVMGVNLGSSYMRHAAVALGEGTVSKDIIASGTMNSSHYNAAIEAKARKIQKESRGKLDYITSRQIAGSIGSNYGGMAVGDMLSSMDPRDVLNMSISSMSSEASEDFKNIKNRDMRTKAYGAMYGGMGLSERQMQLAGEYTDMLQGGFRGRDKSRKKQQTELNDIYNQLTDETKKLMRGEQDALANNQFKDIEPVLQKLIKEFGFDFNIGELFKKLFGFVEDIRNTVIGNEEGVMSKRRVKIAKGKAEIDHFKTMDKITGRDVEYDSNLTGY